MATTGPESSGGKKRLPLHTRILIGLLLGAITGGIAQATLGKDDPNLKWFTENVATPGGNIFLYLLFMLVVPLLFSALLLGVAELGNAARVGRIGFLALGMTVLLSGTAVLIGVGSVNLVNPGKTIPEAQRQELREQYASKTDAEKNLEAAKRVADDPPVLGFIPRNPFKEMNRALEGGLLPFMFFALFFGIALAGIDPEKSAPVLTFFDGIFAACQQAIAIAMRYGPIGVFFLVFRTAATLGLDLFQAIGVYVLLVLAALAFHQFVVYSLALKYIAKMDPRWFFRQMRSTMLTAFATSSSNATLPTALKASTEELGLPKRISSFVLTVGATANQNGTALFEGITIVFLCQLFGVDLTLAQQFTVMGLAIVAGIGTAGIPGGAWPMIASILVMFKVPAEMIGIVIGIDRILDMSRTVLNVTGDMTIAACVSRLAGEPNQPADEMLE